MHVVVLGGIARVGKTDICDILEMDAAAEGMRVKRISFATPLKEAVAEENGYGKDWRKFKDEKPEVYRDQCQEIGAARRAENPDHWVDLWEKQLDQLQKDELAAGTYQEYLVLVDDCRYENELEAAKRWEALTMFVYAGSRISDVPDIDAEWREHESEAMSEKIESMQDGYTNLFEWAIFNDKGLRELEMKLEERMDHLLGMHPARFGRKCDCNECLAFKADVQASELIDQFRTALAELFEDDSLEDEFKDSVREAFEDIIEDLESGRKKPMDFFRSTWWKDALKDNGLELEGDDDEDAEDGPA